MSKQEKDKEEEELKIIQFLMDKYHKVLARLGEEEDKK